MFRAALRQQVEGDERLLELLRISGAEPELGPTGAHPRLVLLVRGCRASLAAACSAALWVPLLQQGGL